MFIIENDRSLSGAVPPVQYATTSDGYRIGYAVSGAGTPFVFMPPGWSNFARYWSTPVSAMWGAFQERFRLIQYDSRGQGSSTRGLHGQVTIEDYERDPETVLDAAGADRAILFGLSIFTHVAIRFAAKHPERVEALVLWGIDSNSRPSGSDAVHSPNAENALFTRGFAGSRTLRSREARGVGFGTSSSLDAA